MKLNRIITLCAAAALTLGAGNLMAQDNGGDNGGSQRHNRGGSGGTSGRGNYDPAQMQQHMMDRYQEQLGFTNDTDWDAVKPLVQKVMDARRDVGFGGMSRMFGSSRTHSSDRGGDQGGSSRSSRGSSMFGQPSAEEDALQKALDDNAPSGQIKDLLAKYKSAQKAKQAKLEAAQADLKKVLTTKQEAQAYLLQLVN